MTTERPTKVRRPRRLLEPVVDYLIETLGEYGDVVPCGSYRRQSQMVGDLDLVLVTEETLNFVNTPVDLEIHERGGKLIHSVLKWPDQFGEGINVDIYAVPPDQMGAMLWYLTGPMELNIAMRATAKSKGWKLNQVGLFNSVGERFDDGTEQGIVKLLKWPWIAPASRNDWEEILQEPSNALGTRMVRSSDGAHFYTLTQYASGEWGCTCKGYLFRKECRHVKELTNAE